jgi:hypothetical protein
MRYGSTPLRKLLLIRGLGHSGTTILDLALGSHPSMLGLGEGVRILRTPVAGEESRGPARLREELRHKRLCTCGLTAAQCPVWGDVLEWLPGNDQLPLPDKLRCLLDSVDRFSGMQGRAVEWIIDSSQEDLQLPLERFSDLEVRVVFLVRDVRSWVHSRTPDAERRGKQLPRLRTLGRWTKVNLRFERELRRCGKPVFLLGYEQLALDPERHLGRLCEWLGLGFHAAMLRPGGSSSSHILAGNRMRFNPEKSREIRYDGAWLQGSVWPASPALLFPPLARLNKRLVYSDGSFSG